MVEGELTAIWRVRRALACYRCADGFEGEATPLDLLDACHPTDALCVAVAVPWSDRTLALYRCCRIEKRRRLMRLLTPGALQSAWCAVLNKRHSVTLQGPFGPKSFCMQLNAGNAFSVAYCIRRFASNREMLHGIRVIRDLATTQSQTSSHPVDRLKARGCPCACGFHGCMEDGGIASRWNWWASVRDHLVKAHPGLYAEVVTLDVDAKLVLAALDERPLLVAWEQTD